jgi:hypothetical protein
MKLSTEKRYNESQINERYNDEQKISITFFANLKYTFETNVIPMSEMTSLLEDLVTNVVIIDVTHYTKIY